MLKELYVTQSCRSVQTNIVLPCTIPFNELSCFSSPSKCHLMFCFIFLGLDYVWGLIYNVFPRRTLRKLSINSILWRLLLRKYANVFKFFICQWTFHLAGNCHGCGLYGPVYCTRIVSDDFTYIPPFKTVFLSPRASCEPVYIKSGMYSMLH